MAKIHSTTEPELPHPSKARRNYTVGYVLINRDHTTPAIWIKGKWLDEVGFYIGEQVTVRIMHGCLVITTKEAPSPNSSSFLSRFSKHNSGLVRRQLSYIREKLNSKNNSGKSRD